jgi:hypothetical protein
VLACALAMAGCGGTDEPTGGTGAVSGGGAGGTNPASGGTGGMNPASGGTSGNPASGGTSGGGGSGGMVTAGDGGGGGGGGSTGGTSGSEAMCTTTCGSTMDLQSDSTCGNVASGEFAIKTVIDVWWEDDVMPPLVDPGRGFITVYLKGTLTDICSDGSDGCGEMMGCGVILPAFASWANCNAYQITFPDDLWEKPGMPKFNTHGSTTGFEPGSVLTIAKATGLIGFAMDDEAGDWPTSIDTVACMASVASGNIADCFPDHDGDELAGVSIKMGGVGTNYKETGCGIGNGEPVKFQGAPLDGALGAICDPMTDTTCKRATDLSIGLRTRLGGGGDIAECTATSAHGAGASDAEYLDSRVIDCKLNDGMPCTLDNAKFVDSSAPTYNILQAGESVPEGVLKGACECGDCLGEGCPFEVVPSKGSRSAVVRLGDVGMPFDCAAVRTAVDAQYPGTDI